MNIDKVTVYTFEEIAMNVVRSGWLGSNKIEMIKRFRYATGGSLREAKQAIDEAVKVFENEKRVAMLEERICDELRDWVVNDTALKLAKRIVKIMTD